MNTITAIPTYSPIQLSSGSGILQHAFAIQPKKGLADLTQIDEDNWSVIEEDVLREMSLRWSTSASSSMISLLDATPLSVSTIRLVGNNGARRFNMFKSIEAGWDFGSGEALDRKSIESLNFFADNIKRLPKKPVSLFLRHEGNLSIVYRDEGERIIELEFLADGIHYFIQEPFEDGLVPTERIGELLGKLELS